VPWVCPEPSYHPPSDLSQLIYKWTGYNVGRMYRGDGDRCVWVDPRPPTPPVYAEWNDPWYKWASAAADWLVANDIETSYHDTRQFLCAHKPPRYAGGTAWTPPGPWWAAAPSTDRYLRVHRARVGSGSEATHRWWHRTDLPPTQWLAERNLPLLPLDQPVLLADGHPYTAAQVQVTQCDQLSGASIRRPGWSLHLADDAADYGPFTLETQPTSPAAYYDDGSLYGLTLRLPFPAPDIATWPTNHPSILVVDGTLTLRADGPLPSGWTTYGVEVISPLWGAACRNTQQEHVWPMRRASKNIRTRRDYPYFAPDSEAGHRPLNYNRIQHTSPWTYIRPFFPLGAKTRPPRSGMWLHIASPPAMRYIADWMRDADLDIDASATLWYIPGP
jgi:hypothetical protein